MNPLASIQKSIDKIHNKILFFYKGIDGSNVDIRGSIFIFGKNPQISFGKNVTINSSVRSNPTGGGTTHMIFNMFDGGRVVVGNNSGISNSTIVCCDSVTIGDNVNIGVNNVIYDNDMHSVEYINRIDKPDRHIKSAPVVIDDGAWICGHCIILKGVHIGKRSVVAAGSVVSRDIPDDELWGGNPCRFIRKINQD